MALSLSTQGGNEHAQLFLKGSQIEPTGGEDIKTLIKGLL